MARYRLRYQATDLDMPIGDFVVGRSAECSLAVDDTLVSRRHAVLRVTDEGVVIEDMGSRNGVLVNGDPLTEARHLRHLDRVRIGGQELMLIEIGAPIRESRSRHLGTTCRRCRRPVALGVSSCPSCGASVDDTVPRAALEPDRPLPDDEEVTKRVSAFALVAGVAEKALMLGHPEEAERILSNLLGDFLQRAESGKMPSEESVRDATRYALRLAELTGKSRWIDWVFSIHTVTARLLMGETIDQLYELVKKVKHPGSEAFRSYLALMRARVVHLSPNERFLLQRLEGLERVVGA